jgi:hypothetical protein
MEQFLRLAPLIEQVSNEGSSTAAMVGDREIHDAPVLADQPDFIEERRGLIPRRSRSRCPRHLPFAFLDVSNLNNAGWRVPSRQVIWPLP